LLLGLPLLNDISCLHGAQQQTRRTPPLLSIDGTDLRPDGRMLSPYYAYYVGSVNNLVAD